VIVVMDLKSYFQRIGFEGEPAPTLETLAILQRRHAEAIPFENLDSLLKQPVRLDLPSLEQKLVHRGRGGYCFEQNRLFKEALEAIGFAVTGLAARVVWNIPEGVIPPRSHMLLRVDLEGKSWIADVGFGVLTLTAPLRLEADSEQATPHETFRLVSRNGEFLMESRIRDRWMPMYRFDLTPQERADYEVSNWHVSTHPESLFVNFLLASRVAPGVRHTLFNNEMSTHHTNAGTEKRLLTNSGELRDALTNVIGLNLPDGPEVDALLERMAASPAS